MTGVHASPHAVPCALLLALAALGVPECRRAAPADPALASATRFVEGSYAWSDLIRDLDHLRREREAER